MTNLRLLAIPLLICAMELLGVSMGQMDPWYDVQRISEERFQQCKLETRTVKFESFKARGGHVYKRTLTKDWIVGCMTLTQLDAKNIFHCANLAEKAGQNGFTFSGKCIGIGEILPWTTADGCDDCSDLVIVYAADPPLNDTELKFDEPDVTANPLDYLSASIVVKQSCEWKLFRYTVNGQEIYDGPWTSKRYGGLERCKELNMTAVRLLPNGQEIGPLKEHIFFVPAGQFDSSGFYDRLSLNVTEAGNLTLYIQWNQIPELCGSLTELAVYVWEYRNDDVDKIYHESLFTYYNSSAKQMTLGPIVELCLAHELEFFGHQRVGLRAVPFYTNINLPLSELDWSFSYSKDDNTLTVDWTSTESVDVCGLLPGMALDFTTYLQRTLKNTYTVAYDNKSITLPDARSFTRIDVIVPSLQNMRLYTRNTVGIILSARADAVLTTFSECVQLGRESGRRLLTLRDRLHLRDEDTWIEHTPSDDGLTARAEDLREDEHFADQQNNFCAVARAGDARARRVDCASQQRCVTIEN